MTYTVQSTITEVQPAPALPDLYWVKHDVERGPLWRWHVPEVFPLTGTNTFLNREWQLFTFALNPLMRPLKWRALHGYQTAFCNFDAGFDYPGGSTKPDYVNGFDLTATGRLRYDKCRICGGAIVSGTPIYSIMLALRNALGLLKDKSKRSIRSVAIALSTVNTLKLNYLDGNQPPPRMEDVKLWQKFCALNVVNETTLSRFPQGDGNDVWMALVATEQPYIPLESLMKLDTTIPLPSPYQILQPA